MASFSAALQRSSSLLPRRSLASFTTSSHVAFKQISSTRLLLYRSPFHQTPIRCFSGIPSPLTGTGIVTEEPETTQQGNAPKLPTSLAPEAGLGAQDAMRLFVQYGIGKGGLDAVAEETRRVSKRYSFDETIWYTVRYF